MKIAIIGTGYVGLPSGVGFAELGHSVVCVDNNKAKIEALNRGELTLYENGLADLFKTNTQQGRLRFTTSMKEGVQDADLVIIAVGTPPDPITHEADLQYIYAAATELAEHLTGYTVIANKSTVPVGTGDAVEKIISAKNPAADFDVVSLPEFLREGFAVQDFFNPDRIILGTNSERAIALISKLYEPFREKTPILIVSRKSSETIKYASNAFLAMKIHYINEIANFCEKSGANVAEVAKGMGLDTRIGNRFLNAGIGFGGSCFPKDTMAMVHMANKYGVHVELIEATIAGNNKRKKEMAERVYQAVKDNKNPKVAVWGLAFKNGTDDCRQSPAMDVIQELLSKKINIIAYDPKAMDTAKVILGDKIQYAPDMYSAVQKVDALVILTEWPEFSAPDFDKLSELMNRKVIFDLRNMLSSNDALEHQFEYHCIGRKFS